jgi:hypothetical protein
MNRDSFGGNDPWRKEERGASKCSNAFPGGALVEFNDELQSFWEALS